MRLHVSGLPRYAKNQMVSFMGGIGRIINYHPDSNSWRYAVEMELGPEPDFGRIGYETTILLNESEINAVLS
ncbi:hypothetical protein ACE1B6_08740 [Aerosakkonemataceae cyanobacterium BLCC-F154]|uniref:Uncharacterized protein n=1 Tax=Floridaenema fluviatile BLCC-F154 TaxID=3153640 RepID=A0ABV4YB54_9CYAN